MALPNPYNDNKSNLDQHYEYWANKFDSFDKSTKLVCKMFANDITSAEVCLQAVMEQYVEEMDKFIDESGQENRRIIYTILKIPRNPFSEQRNSLN